MNIFLPYPNDIKKSVRSLDSIRLNKQILEAKVLLDGSLAYLKGKVENGYFKHPVAQFYKDNPQFLAWYGYECCLEYKYRFEKEHQLETYFRDNEIWEVCPDEKGFITPKYIPYYMEGSIDSPNCIRTTSNDVGILFQAKLIGKWLNDKRHTQWGKRGEPKFWQNFIETNKNDKDNYWQLIGEIKNANKLKKEK